MLEPGTFAVDPLPSGSPWRRWAELEVGEAEALGWYAPRFSISDGPAGQVLLAPGDVRDAVIDPALAGDSACCGLDGGEPNMACVTCGALVATRVDDCGRPQAVWLDPLTTRVIEDGPGPHPVLDWTGLIDQRPGIPPSEPDGGWHPMWAAATASALAHLLAVSGGDPILTPDHRVAGIFRPTLDRLVGPVSAGPERTLVLAGPGLPAADGDFALVPEHPQTGEHWPVAQPVKPVPLAWDAWRHLAFHRDPKPVGRSVPILPETLPALLPGYRLEPDAHRLECAPVTVTERHHLRNVAGAGTYSIVLGPDTTVPVGRPRPSQPRWCGKVAGVSDRIVFPGNPWPTGHAVEELAWLGRLDPAGRLWFDLHVKSAEYHAEDPAYWDDDTDSDDDWSSKIVWGNYHACTISSTYWGHRGFVAATDGEPLALDTLAGRTFHVDRDPDRPDAVPDGVADEDIEDDEAAFGIYLLGHDAVGDHRIRFGARRGRTAFALDWQGRIALRYANSMAPFRYTFQVMIGAVALDHIAIPSSLDDGAAEALLRRVLVDAAMFDLLGEGDGRRFVAR